MRIGAQQKLDLLTMLSEGLFDPSPWQSFLDAVLLQTHAQYVSLIFRSVDRPLNSIFELSAGERWPDHLQQLYKDEIYKSDDIPYHDFQEGRVYAFDEIFSNDTCENHSTYHQFIQNTPSPFGRIMRISEPSGVSAWMSISSRNDFSRDVTEFISEIAPLLRTSLRTLVAMEREKFRTKIANDAISSLGFGWMVLDVQCHILDSDLLAESALQQSGELRRTSDGRLAARSHAVASALLNAARTFANDGESKPRAINFPHEKGTELLLMSVKDRTIFSKTAPVLIAYMRRARQHVVDHAEQLVELYGLLPCEARLAVKLSEGRSISESAENLGIKTETARSYSKIIYEKTGTNSQSTLMHSLLTSVASLAS